jgi:hypothetical protein
MKTRAFLLASLLVAAIIPSRAKSRDPIFVSPDFKPALVDQVSVFVVDPSNDVANNKECIGGAEYGTLSGGGAEPTLAKRGYGRHGRATLTRFYQAQTAPSEALLSNPTKEWLQGLANQKISRPQRKGSPAAGPMDHVYYNRRAWIQRECRQGLGPHIPIHVLV